MEISHPTTIRVGKNDYDYNVISVTKTYGGSKQFSDGTNIYLEDNNGKVETMGIDFKPDIPPSTRLISTLWGEDKKTKKTFRFGYYIHSNDFLGYTTNQNSQNAAKRIIPLQGIAQKLEKWRLVITGLLAVIFAWTAFWVNPEFSVSGLLNFLRSIPFVLWDTPILISELSQYGSNYGNSYGRAFLGLIAGFALSKAIISFSVGRLRNKLRLAFGSSLEKQLPSIFANADKPSESTPMSSSTNAASSDVKTDADGYQTLI
ncbi:hypothetical protein ACVFI8_11410 [Agarivorans sp. MS3-6]|uniref:hypothetical protein n=1 Tax=Agarivorans sp. TSD2052 TaxID=2937286 RepID=UPI00200DE09A|nr:hypothetical protein [Agarivorans sp. TSD2052]UPW18426.1 hypothetical protein M0C34_19725 [Agarivorans sp. TSD2052]